MTGASFPLDYKNAGVDIDAGNEFVRRIRALVRSTFRPEVLTDIGGFGGLFRFNPKKYKDPVLVSGTDGVGTKLKIASLLGRHDTVGVDLVAMRSEEHTSELQSPYDLVCRLLLEKKKKKKNIVK